MDEQAQKDAFSQDFNKGYSDLIATQNRQQADLTNQYRQQIAGQETQSDAFGRLRNEAGLPALENQLSTYQGDIAKVQNLLDRLDEDVTNRTKGSLTTESQRNRQIAFEGDPLQKNLGRLGIAEGNILNAINSKSGLVNQQLGFLQNQQEKELDPTRLGLSQQADRFARETTGYTAERQNELSFLLDGLQRGRQLSDAEWARANKLADDEKAYAQQLKLAQLNKASSGASSGIDLNSILQLFGLTGTTPAKVTQSQGATTVTLDQLLSQFGQLTRTGPNTGRAIAYPGQTVTATY